MTVKTDDTVETVQKIETKENETDTNIKKDEKVDDVDKKVEEKVNTDSTNEVLSDNKEDNEDEEDDKSSKSDDVDKKSDDDDTDETNNGEEVVEDLEGIDLDEVKPSPKTLEQARSLRNENKKIKLYTKTLEEKFQKLEQKVAEFEMKEIVTKKTAILSKHGLPETHIKFLLGDTEKDWEQAATELLPNLTGRVSSNVVSNGFTSKTGKKPTNTDAKEIWNSMKKHR